MFRPILFSVLGVLIVGVAVVLILAARKPDVFRVRRSARINAPPERIFPLINDFHQWGCWSPYEKLDPKMKRTYSGEAGGPGAVYAWDGNGNVGTGRITITETSRPERIALLLEMSRPFACRNDVQFTLQEEDGGTNVTWAMEGPSHFASKVMSVFINMDKMCGGQFEEGLANLKAVAEKEPVTVGTATRVSAAAARL